MQAIILEKTGTPDQLKQVEIPQPAIQDQEVLVHVKAIGINPVDAAVRSNEWALKHFLHLNGNGQPIILGWDIAGIVEKVGAGVKDFKKGDEVFGMVNFTGQGRAYAEYVAAPAAHLAKKPANISFNEAAAATLAALTAYQSLVTFGNVQAGEKILIHRAAGGVGHFAVQIAKHLGAYVIGTGSAHSKAFILQLGADEFVDYKAKPVEQAVTGVDLVLDSLPGNHVLQSVNSIKDGGRLISLLDTADESLKTILQKRGIYFHKQDVRSNGEEMKVIAGWLESGAVHSVIEEVFPFSALSKAHEAIESGRTHGKIVVAV